MFVLSLCIPAHYLCNRVCLFSPFSLCQIFLISLLMFTVSDTESIIEENRQLKEQRLCKVCLDFEATIAFLPCGHIVCCTDCAPAMRKCPICRAHVKGTVKTFLS